MKCDWLFCVKAQVPKLVGLKNKKDLTQKRFNFTKILAWVQNIRVKAAELSWTHKTAPQSIKVKVNGKLYFQVPKFMAKSPGKPKPTKRIRKPHPN